MTAAIRQLEELPTVLTIHLLLTESFVQISSAVTTNTIYSRLV